MKDYMKAKGNFVADTGSMQKYPVFVCPSERRTYGFYSDKLFNDSHYIMNGVIGVIRNGIGTTTVSGFYRPSKEINGLRTPYAAGFSLTAGFKSYKQY